MKIENIITHIKAIKQQNHIKDNAHEKTKQTLSYTIKSQNHDTLPNKTQLIIKIIQIIQIIETQPYHLPFFPNHTPNLKPHCKKHQTEKPKINLAVQLVTLSRRIYTYSSIYLFVTKCTRLKYAYIRVYLCLYNFISAYIGYKDIMHMYR